MQLLLLCLQLISNYVPELTFINGVGYHLTLLIARKYFHCTIKIKYQKCIHRQQDDKINANYADNLPELLRIVVQSFTAANNAILDGTGDDDTKTLILIHIYRQDS